MIIELLLKIEQVWMLFPGFTLLNEPDSGVYFIHVCQQCEVNSGNIISLASPPLPTNLLKLTLPSTSSRILNLSHEVRQQFQFYFYMYSFILLGVCKLCRGAYIRLRLQHQFIFTLTIPVGITPKKWNKFDIWCISLACLPLDSSNDISNIYFMCCSNRCNALQMASPIAADLCRLELGIQVYDFFAYRYLSHCTCYWFVV